MIGAMTIEGRPGAGLVYLLDIVYPNSGSVGAGLTTDIETISGRTVGGFRSFHVSVPPLTPVASTQYFASEDWTVPETDPDQPNRWYDGRLSDPGATTRSVALTAVDASGIVATVASMGMENSDGGLDGLPNNGLLINAPVQLRVGVRGDTLADYQIVATGFVQSADVGLNDATLDIGGSDDILTAPFFDQIYAGTGGLEGALSLEGVRKPYVLGAVLNISPTMIDPVLFIFQAHAGGALGAITAVRFGGVPMVFTADYPDLATLAAAVVAIGEYATCIALGLVKPGLTSGGVDGSYVLTADIEGTTIRAALLADEVVQQINTELNLPYDAAAFAALDAMFPGYIYGRFIDSPVTYADVMNDIMRNMNAYWGDNREGEITANVLIPPESAGPVIASYNEHDILSIDRLGLPAGFEWPHKERTVQYARNWTPQTNLAAVVEDAAFSVEYKELRVLPAVANRTALTPDPINTNLRDKVDADALATQVLAQHGTVRQMYAVTLSIFSTSPGLLNMVNMQYPRFGLKGGRDMVTVAITENYAEGTLQVTLWG